ncbi:hypothetical protein FDK21_17725 [Cohaesibacter sp. CAU 1516]|uniref:hypothetical protein n=1 Tax=Cohaesibacter sp. CAU 1516 TaxID=2576038 RepID=UPI0010FEF109|nr:hypothetical protein [Cohaesibacter sp. CAU 1516]TLP43396.1 hypothetical protein FDK21_17725 [Cohaesibacter sp. CAU 1516]
MSRFGLVHLENNPFKCGWFVNTDETDGFMVDILDICMRETIVKETAGKSARWKVLRRIAAFAKKKWRFEIFEAPVLQSWFSYFGLSAIRPGREENQA